VKRLVSAILIISQAFFSNPSLALDPTDTSKPKFSIKLVSAGTNAFNSIIFEVKATDDKNGIRLQDWRQGIQPFTGRSMLDFWKVGSTSPNLAPICSSEAVLPVYIFDENPPIQDLDFASKSRTYYLVNLVERHNLPKECAGTEVKISSATVLALVDEANNLERLTYPQKDFVLPITNIGPRLCIGLGKSYAQNISYAQEYYKKLFLGLEVSLSRYPAYKLEFEKSCQRLASWPRSISQFWKRTRILDPNHSVLMIFSSCPLVMILNS